ncbi:hypothetical protein P9F83_01425 [Peribacillus psychrosaccharolyticus]|uniref:hypothetical protein n=1 Tax=Peribacillus psychrosaccharolyticus TaxID=1407 RepID=UPI0002E93BA7|nr:hypothetical protein [Peribacillus psychrosaccharolyticus]MEC2053911.1 hypothetical protein [Peribacillus psychrosaccharolyticus]MED3742475.1 hypothetical protein [Peribacillus psychrosaccharolyticus]
MTGIAIILVLAALTGFFFGLLGIIKGNVKLLKLKNKSKAGLCCQVRRLPLLQ